MGPGPSLPITTISRCVPGDRGTQRPLALLLLPLLPCPFSASSAPARPRLHSAMAALPLIFFLLLPLPAAAAPATTAIASAGCHCHCLQLLLLPLPPAAVMHLLLLWQMFHSRPGGCCRRLPALHAGPGVGTPYLRRYPIPPSESPVPAALVLLREDWDALLFLAAPATRSCYKQRPSPSDALEGHIPAGNGHIEGGGLGV